jgi:hypothetical protein
MAINCSSPDLIRITLTVQVRLNRRCSPVSDYTPSTFSAPPFSALGQEQSFEQTKISREFASFIKVIASIEDPAVIQKILAHLNDNATSEATALLPDCRASPPAGLFD